MLSPDVRRHANRQVFAECVDVVTQKNSCKSDQFFFVLKVRNGHMALPRRFPVVDFQDANLALHIRHLLSGLIVIRDRR